MMYDASNMSLLACLLLLITMATASTKMRLEDAHIKPQPALDDADLLQADDDIPPLAQHWPHRPVFLKASRGTNVLGLESGQALPLGVPFEFESPLFKGTMLVRLRNAKSDHPSKCQEYFKGSDRVMQAVVQGRFKKPVNMADLYVGGVFRKPMRLQPPPFVMSCLRRLFHKIAPGAILDLTSPKPKVLSLLAGAAQTMTVTPPGELPPDITSFSLPEHMGAAGGGLPYFRSTAHRQRQLSIPHRAAQHTFDTASTYTMEIHDAALDFGRYQIKLPVVGNYNLSNAIGAQPMCLSAVTAGGETLWHLDVWHESVYQQIKMSSSRQP